MRICLPALQAANSYPDLMQYAPRRWSAIGPDRTGLVESRRAVAEHGGNWLESRMCRLGGEFAGILRVEIPAEKKAPLLAALQKIPGLNVVVQPDQPVARAAAGRRIKLEIFKNVTCPGFLPRNHQRPRGVFLRIFSWKQSACNIR